MGSKILASVDQEEELPALEMVPSWFEEWEQILSRFRIDSELSRLNARAGSPVEVSPELWEVHMAAVEAERVTGGLVSALVLPDVLRAGYDRSFDLLAQEASIPWLEPNQEPVVAAARRSLEDIICDGSRRRIQLPEDAGLDYGGVAKGWAAHKAMLRLSGTAPALVSAGGDIAVSGPRANGDPWVIDVEDPLQPGAFVEKIYLRAGGIATSGRDRRQWRRGGMPMHHVIDPRTGSPARTDIISATVVSTSAMRAEALAKAVLILGSKAGMEWLGSMEDAAGMVVLQSGDMLYSQSLDKYL